MILGIAKNVMTKRGFAVCLVICLFQASVFLLFFTLFVWQKENRRGWVSIDDRA